MVSKNISSGKNEIIFFKNILHKYIYSSIILWKNINATCMQHDDVINARIH